MLSRLAIDHSELEPARVAASVRQQPYPVTILARQCAAGFLVSFDNDPVHEPVQPGDKGGEGHRLLGPAGLQDAGDVARATPAGLVVSLAT
jgi:hypothetical protein